MANIQEVQDVPGELRVKACSALACWLIFGEIPFKFFELESEFVLDPDNTDVDMQCVMLEATHLQENDINVLEDYSGVAFELVHGVEGVFYELIDRGEGKPNIEIHYRDR